MKNSIPIGTTDEGKSLSLDINKLIDSRMLVQGNSGSGKSGLLRLLCERAAGHVPFIILDPEGEFATLREKVDAVLVGPQGDIATDLRSAALLARKLIELQVSGIIDLYELKPHQRREYVKLFLDALIELPRDLWHPTLILIDEAHKFCPEKGQGDYTSTESVINLMSLGRKRGFSGILSTQRFSKLHNDAIAETNNVFIGRTWLDADQKRAGDYLGMSNADRRSLRDIKVREFYAFGPALSINGIAKFKTDTVATTHPKAGERYKLTPPAASDAIQHIVAQIDDLPEVAEQEKKDIASLKAENAELKRELAERPTVPQTVEVEKIVERPAITPEVFTAVESLADAISFKIVELTTDLSGNVGDFQAVVDQLRESIGASASAQPNRPPATAAAAAPQFESARQTAPAAPVQSYASPKQPSAPSLPNDSSLKQGELKVLTAIAQDPNGVTQEYIAIMTGYKATSRNEYVRQLVARGYVVKAGSVIQATDAGVNALGPNFEKLPTGAALREYWLNNLGGGEKAVFEIVMNAHPNGIHKSDIEQQSGYKSTSVNEYTRLLAVRRLVTRSSGVVRAADHLF